ncbi:MAG TPA: polysaccharide deacetylase family protein [Cyclobacteriaceae bacterium]|nr:polysaccharide deacetylase family protein [Cyclobacteriaceae bacterium]
MIRINFVHRPFHIEIILVAIALTLPWVGCSRETPPTNKKTITDANGAIIRGDTSQHQIALVFTGHEFADGGIIIRNTLKGHHIQAAFFLTGDFYQNPAFKSLIEGLKQDGHYLGAHSDKHLLYADWLKRDSLLITKEEFKMDLKNNYERMAAYGITKSDAPYFLPPFEWYNRDIADWTKELDLQLINFTPGTRSTADYTYPEMGAGYLPTDKIYESILDYEMNEVNGLNGFILLVHIGTDQRRTDKFYKRLDDLISSLSSKGYRFVRINRLLDDNDR